MDVARRAVCTDDFLNPLTSTFMQSCVMLLISQFFHVILKPLGQPGPVAQILVHTWIFITNLRSKEVGT